MEASVSPATLREIVQEFYEELERRFGTHVHILDWALHLDEGTPHIHERHVFDCRNRYGELCPQQEKALEELGIPLPSPEKPKGKHNNRKQTFDAICRTMLFDICHNHGLHLEQEPSYGGRAYLEKQDYILMKQKAKLEELTQKIETVETLLDEVSEVAYDKAVEVVADQVRAQTQQEDLAVIEAYRKNITSTKTQNSPRTVRIANTILSRVQEKLQEAAERIMRNVLAALRRPEVRAAGTKEIQSHAKKSLAARLQEAQAAMTAANHNQPLKPRAARKEVER